MYFEVMKRCEVWYYFVVVVKKVTHLHISVIKKQLWVTMGHEFDMQEVTMTHSYFIGADNVA